MSFGQRLKRIQGNHRDLTMKQLGTKLIFLKDKLMLEYLNMNLITKHQEKILLRNWQTF